MQLNNVTINHIIDRIDFENIKDHPNILIAAHFWDEERYHAAKVCYKFMRMIDDLVDNRKAKGAAFSDMEKVCFTDQVHDWINCLENLGAGSTFEKELVETVLNFKIPLELFQNFARSMIYDIHHSGFQTFDDFLDYSEGASVAPASVFVHLCSLQKTDNQYHPATFDVIKVARPCAIFSYLVHIIRDFQKDQMQHLNYFPLDILNKYSLTPENLKNMAHGGPVKQNFRSMMSEYHAKAILYKNKTLEMIERLENQLDQQYYLSLKVIYNLYLMVFERINIQEGLFTTEELNPTPSEIKTRVMIVANGD